MAVWSRPTRESRFSNIEADPQAPPEDEVKLNPGEREDFVGGGFVDEGLQKEDLHEALHQRTIVEKEGESCPPRNTCCRMMSATPRTFPRGCGGQGVKWQLKSRILARSPVLRQRDRLLVRLMQGPSWAASVALATDLTRAPKLKSKPVDGQFDALQDHGLDRRRLYRGGAGGCPCRTAHARRGGSCGGGRETGKPVAATMTAGWTCASLGRDHPTTQCWEGSACLEDQPWMDLAVTA